MCISRIMPEEPKDRVVWVRDPLCGNYQQWAKAYFVRVVDDPKKRHHVFVRYGTPYPSHPSIRKSTPSGAGGLFPEYRFDQPPREECEEREWA